MVVLVRLRWDEATRRYMARRTAEGKTKPEIIRCLKRYVARQLFPLLVPAPWTAGAGSGGLSSGTFYGRFRRYLADAGLPPSGLHILRHTAAKLRRDAGESVEAVSSFLDHSSLVVTTVYLRRLEGQADTTWSSVAAAIGA
jgi:integrase